ncbi:33942_t:CDS:2 [Racocetra persica]|uniref:33942_t:CDS:1 n=1 Tax=Racocetra persica TaxID=160502 RepID=A0ACA9N9E0_9GLOM|nr:33942_t:CDS:2 [Racocetra persica]
MLPHIVIRINGCIQGLTALPWDIPEQLFFKALSSISPSIEFAPNASTSKSTTAAVGKAPKNVRLGEGSFKKVNRHTFDLKKKFQILEFDHFTRRSQYAPQLMLTSILVLNTAMGADYDFSD